MAQQIVRILALSVLCAANALAGFTPGDIVLVSASAGVSPNPEPAVLLIKPATIGVSAIKVGIGMNGDGAFDSYRNRVVVLRTTQFIGHVISLIDSDGSVVDLTYPGADDATLVAPTGDGRMYLQRSNKFSYIDAAGVTHDLLNISGPGVFVPARVWIRMYYDRATNSLFMGGSSGINAVITKIPLSPDGTRLASSPIDTLYVTANLSNPRVGGFSPGPNGTVFIKLDDNSFNTAPRMLLMNPATIDIDVFSNSGYSAVAAEIAGCYSDALNAAIVVDSLTDCLRVFTSNSNGGGVVFIRPLVSSSGGSAENATIFPITASVGVCPGDINKDGQVDDADFILFVSAYNILDCADPAMPAGCPADFNHDGVVDDSDFSIFVVAYNALVCP
ncbi:MAG: hypothetical protein ACREJD_02195 [Phycisphaerales bacterium]